MDEPVNNSNKARREAEAVPPKDVPAEKVVKAAVVRGKKPLGTRFKDFFLKGESFEAVVHRVWTEVVVPGAIDVASDSFDDLKDRILYPNGSSTRSRGRSKTSSSSKNGNATYVPYSSVSSGNKEQSRGQLSKRGRVTHDLDDIKFGNRGDAEMVLDYLLRRIEKFDQVTLAAFYEMTGEDPEFTDYKWGWTDLNGSRVERGRRGDGYRLSLPRPEPLD